MIRESTRSWSFPYCQACQAHISHYDESLSHAKTVQTTGWIAAASIVLLAVTWIWIIVPLALVAFSYHSHRQARDAHAKAVAQQRASCAALGAAVEYHGWQGSVHSFTFQRDEYAAKFEASNAKKLLR